MIPNFDTFSTRYLRAACIPVVVVSALLTSSLLRNVIDISLWEMVAGLGAICLSIVWSMMRDGRGYWVYTVFTMRVYETPEEIARRIEHLSLGGASRLFYQPLAASLLTLAVVVLLSLAAWLCGPQYRYPLIGLLGVVLLPAVMLWQLDRSVPFLIRQAMMIHKDKANYASRPRRLPACLAEDLLLGLLVNFALVLPIGRKAEFSLAAGYGNPAFIVAFMILLTIVMLFMFFFAIRPRRYVILGDMLIGNIAADFAPCAPWALTARLARPWRLVIWLIAVALWSVAICLLFQTLKLPQSFVPFYLCSLLPIVLIYCAERYQALYDNHLEAQEMRQRYETIAAAVNAKLNKA